MDRDFATTQEILLYKLPRPASVAVIDGRSIASGDITEESKPICVVLGNLACVISFNIISSPEHPIVLGLPWFELHNPKIDWKKREIIDSRDNTLKLITTSTSKLTPRHISTISLKRLHKEATIEDMFVFVVVITLFSNPQDSEVHLPSKYQVLHLCLVR